MTSSRSNSWLIFLVVLAGSAFLLPASATAGNRKRVVVLELEGPKAEKFHEDLVKLIKKTHTIIPVDKWNGIAEELDASSPNEKNIKKVAKKLKIDAIVSGKIEKRRDNYIIQLKLREGKTGALVGNRIDVKAEGPRIDGQASSDLKDELIGAIDSVSTNKGGGGDSDSEDEDKPVKKKAGKKDDSDSEDEDKPAKKGFSKKKMTDEEDAEDKPAKKGFTKRDDDETNETRNSKKDDEDKPKKGKKDKDDEEDSPLPKGKKVVKKDDKKDKDDSEDEDGDKKPKKKVAKKDDESDGEEEGEGVEKSGDAVDDSEALSPGERAVDAVLGLSLNARQMAFSYASDLGNAPKPYKGVPVAGLLLDATIYPLAFGHKRHDILRGLGFKLMYDKVIKINSKQAGVTLPTSESRFAVGGAFRYPIGKAVVGATLSYSKQSFTIGSAGGVTSELPDVDYSIVEPAVFARYSITPKVILNVDAGFIAILDTGAIQSNTNYGAATVSGYELALGGDYLLTKNIFVRAAFKLESITMKFKGTGAMSTGRDADPAQDVFGATDKYIGGAATVGYLY